MVRAVERIEQDLATIDEAIAHLATEFHSTYLQYLILLGQAVRQQLIQASYKVCTQGYPQSFLALSFNERQKLQQAVRQLGSQAQEQLLSHLQQPKILSETAATDQPEEIVDQSSVNDEQAYGEPLPNLFEMVLGLGASPEDFNSKTSKKVLSKPEQLAKWIEKLERAIAQTLQTISRQTNRLLQKNRIIPEKLLSSVLEATAQGDPSLGSTTHSANLLNLLMDSESEDDLDNSKITRILAISLRLLEIEFADPALSAARNQIRKLSARLSTLQREYQKNQQELAVAKAEAAWRSSWFED
ncbi:MAG: hypothetical protein U7123_13755 [Potamolinea sp.]